MPRPSPGTRGRSCPPATTPTRSSSTSARCNSTRWRGSRSSTWVIVYAGIGQHRKALDTWLESARMNPDWPDAPAYIGLHLTDLGRLDEALAWVHRARALSEDPWTVRGVAGVSWGVWPDRRVVELAGEVPRDHPFWAVRQAVARNAQGDPAGGLALLEEAIKGSEYVPPAYLGFAANLALLQGKFAASRGYRERVCRRLLDPTPGFDDFGFCNAPAYAFVLQRLGDRAARGKDPERVPEVHRGSAAAGVEGLRHRRRRGSGIARPYGTRRLRACARPSMPAGAARGPDTAGTLLTTHSSPSCAMTPASARSWPRPTPTSPGCASAPRRPRRAATGSRCSRSPRTARDGSRWHRAIEAISPVLCERDRVPVSATLAVTRARNARPV